MILKIHFDNLKRKSQHARSQTSATIMSTVVCTGALNHSHQGDCVSLKQYFSDFHGHRNDLGIFTTLTLTPTPCGSGPRICILNLLPSDILHYWFAEHTLSIKSLKWSSYPRLSLPGNSSHSYTTPPLHGVHSPKQVPSTVLCCLSDQSQSPGLLTFSHTIHQTLKAELESITTPWKFTLREQCTVNLCVNNSSSEERECMMPRMFKESFLIISAIL